MGNSESYERLLKSMTVKIKDFENKQRISIEIELASLGVFIHALRSRIAGKGKSLRLRELECLALALRTPLSELLLPPG